MREMRETVCPNNNYTVPYRATVGSPCVRHCTTVQELPQACQGRGSAVPCTRQQHGVQTLWRALRHCNETLFLFCIYVDIMYMI